MKWLLLLLMCLSCSARADTLAFEGTGPYDDNYGTCSIPLNTPVTGVVMPQRGQDVLVYWSAIKGPAYYFSIVFAQRGVRWYVKRDMMPPGKYLVSVYSKKLTPGARPSCVMFDSISTRP